MDDRDVRRVFRQVRPTREQEEAMLGRILDGEPENRGMRRIKKPVLVLAAVLAVTVCAGAGIALRQAQTRYFDTQEEAWSALREAQGTDAPSVGVYLPREEDRDFPDLVPWDLQAEMSHMDQVTAHAFGSPEDGWTEMCSGWDSYRTYSLYQADTLAGLSEFWPVEAPDFTWLDETYLPLPGGQPMVIDNKVVTSCLQENTAIYDKSGEMHYDIISAFIKSVRGSDPNAAVYYLARMLVGGEDPLFIARRLCILAAEDIGLANPNALLLANSCFQIVHNIGMPEARIPLSETTIYLASSPKSNSAYMAIDKAMELASKTQTSSVPLYLRNAPTKLMEDLGYSDGYKYAHDFPGHFADLEFMPSDLSGTRLYDPADNKKEEDMRKRLAALWEKYGY